MSFSPIGCSTFPIVRAKLLPRPNSHKGFSTIFTNSLNWLKFRFIAHVSTLVLIRVRNAFVLIFDGLNTYLMINHSAYFLTRLRTRYSFLWLRFCLPLMNLLIVPTESSKKTAASLSFMFLSNMKDFNLFLSSFISLYR